MNDRDPASDENSPRFRTALATLGGLGVDHVQIGLMPDWWLTCIHNGETVHSGEHPTAADAVEALLAKVQASQAGAHP